MNSKFPLSSYKPQNVFCAMPLKTTPLDKSKETLSKKQLNQFTRLSLLQDVRCEGDKCS